MSNYIINNGETSTDIILNRYDSMTVLNGGKAFDTTVNSFCKIHVSSGGTVNGAIVNSWGEVLVSSGGTAYSIKVRDCGYFTVYDGGTATSTITNGEFHVIGSADSTTVDDYGDLYVSNGGLANNTTVSGGQVYVSNGTVNNTILSGGHIWISNNGTVNNTTVYSWGGIVVSSGGTATSTSICGGGGTVSSGGTADSTTIRDRGYFGVSSGGTATNINAFAGARLSFDVAPGTYVQGVYAGSAFELNNAFISNYVVNSGGNLTVSSGGTAYRTTISSGGSLVVFSGGTATSTTVNYYGSMIVSSGGTATSTTLNDKGSMFVSYGGTANSTMVSSGGVLNFTNGGTVNNTMVNYNGVLICNFNGTATSTTVNSGGSFVMETYTTVTSTTVNPGGMFDVFGGSVTSTMVSSGGIFHVSECSTATNIFALSGAILSFDVAPDTYVQGVSAGSAFEMKGASLSNYMINSGSINAFSGGIVNSATVNSGGKLIVSSRGTATNTTVNREGCFYISSGGTATGKMTFMDGAIVSAFNKATVNFDISTLAPGAGARINNLSCISGRNNATFTLTVSGTQTMGTYTLAEGAEGFNSTITVKNTSGSSVGTLSVGGTAVIGGASYSLNLSLGTLSVTRSEGGSGDSGGGSNGGTGGGTGGSSQPVDSGTPDGGENDSPLQKDGSLNPSAVIKTNSLSAEGSTTITVDATGSVNKDGYKNCVGGSDKVDYAKITLSKAAKLSFTIEADSKVKLTFYRLVESTKKPGTYTKKVLKSATVSSKNGGEKITAYVLVEGGVNNTYYVSVENKNSKSKGAYYNISLNTAEGKNKSYFYSDGDSGWNNGSLLVKSGKVKVPDTEQIAALKATTIKVSGTQAVAFDSTKPAASDANPIDGGWRNYVGFGDASDYAKLNLTQPVKLNFTVNATGNVKLVVYKVTQNSKGKWVQTTVKTLTVSLKKAEKSTYATRSTGSILLDRLAAGEEGTGYYVSVQSTDAKKGGQAWYNVNVESTVCPSDFGANNKLFTDKKSKQLNTGLKKSTLYANGKNVVLTLETGDINASRNVDGTTYGSFVGFGDTSDYAQVDFKDAGVCTFTVDTLGTAKGTAKFTLYKLTQKSNGVWTKKSMGSITVKNDGKTGYGIGTNTKSINIKEVSDKVKYYVVMEASNSAAKKGEMYYNITASLPSIPSEAALSMPETELAAAGLNAAQNSLFAGLDAAQDTVLASVLLDPAQEKLLGESANGFLAGR